MYCRLLNLKALDNVKICIELSNKKCSKILHYYKSKMNHKVPLHFALNSKDAFPTIFISNE